MTTPFFDRQVFQPGVEFTMVEHDVPPNQKSNVRPVRISTFARLSTAALTAIVLTLGAEYAAATTFANIAVSRAPARAEQLRDAAKELRGWRARAKLLDSGLYSAAPHPSEEEPLPDYGF